MTVSVFDAARQHADSPSVSAQDAASLPAPVASLGIDEFEQGLLPVLRHFLLAHADPRQQAWQSAYTIAAERWGETLGLAAAHMAMKLLRAVVECRDGQFACISPFDLENRACVTADEAALLRMLHHMRRDETPPARDAVVEVTQGQMDPHVIRAGLALAHRFAVGRPGGRPQAPRLQVVG